MQKITPFLWFDTQAEEAASFYVSLFEDSRVGDVSRYGPEGAKGAGMPEGSVMTASFELAGQQFVALNGGPHFKFSEAISFMITCEDQAEVDKFWSALTTDGGEEGPCGWLKDRFGLSWQVVPKRLNELLSDPDKEKSGRAMGAMMKMKRIIVADLEKAAAGG